MAIPIKGKIKREISLAVLASPVVLEITASGIEVSVKGSKSKLSGTWENIMKGLVVPMNGPSYLYGKPLEYLAYKAKKVAEKQQ